MKSIKDIGKCTRSNKIHGNFWGDFQVTNPVYIIKYPTTRRKDKPKFNIMLKPFLLNPPAQRVYKNAQ